MDFLKDSLWEIESYKEMIKDLDGGKKTLSTHGIILENLAHIVYGLSKDSEKQILVITEDEETSRLVYKDLQGLGHEEVEIYPKKELIFYDIDSVSQENIYQRIKVMNKLRDKEKIIVVASFEAISDKIISEKIFDRYTVSLKTGQIVELKDLTELLSVAGYERVDKIEAYGQFSIRGGIVDVSPVSSDYPYRIELFGDEIDTIREFDISSQRSLESLDSIVLPPSKEIILEEDRKNLLIENIKEDLETSGNYDRAKDKFKHYIEKVEEDIRAKNEELMIPYLPKEDISSILNYFQDDSISFLNEIRRVREKWEGLGEIFLFKMTDLLSSGETLASHKNIYFKIEESLEELKSKTLILNSNILGTEPAFNPEGIYDFSVKPTIHYHNKMELLVDDIENYLDLDYKILVLSSSLERAKRLKESLGAYDINAILSEDKNLKLENSNIYISTGTVHSGFEYPDIRLVVLSDKQLFTDRTRKKKKTSLKGEKIISLSDLEVGSYVVHEDHGIGRYEGIDQLEIQGVKKDYISVRYRDEDKLYIPVDQMDLIQRYIGSDARKPRVNKLNSGDWQRTKTKAKKAVEEMAEELIELYAKREESRGYKFSKDTPWQQEFEDSFPYQETEGQLKSIEEIKKDMEGNKPMDRLLCGDVGFGKTEIALRAAFKAVMDSKQVAFLVPTTILAQQHYETIKERFKDFPIKVDVLSRFKTKHEQDLIRENLKIANVDIVVGTHRLLSKDVKFKDLGLLIIDEEQRFGVKDKEKIKQIKADVDVLILTATPIPRTLHMSLSGIRDMSVIEEPPAERFPIQTYVVEYNEQMIRDAILKEYHRGGQVYFVYNRVASIDKVASSLRKLIPEVNIGVAHGQMGENQLENEMLKFANQENDVLVSTTIIETGLDIQNVNTIIIYNADKMGLSQLYQLRGRVGRSNRLAYAYFTYAKDKVLTEVAEKRLVAIKEFTEFGSGFKIAMRDLEIRGAGNLLGMQQHGHIEAIGYDLYVKFLETAVKRLRGEEVEEKVNTTIDLKLNGYIPDKFIGDTTQKIEIYKKIASIDSREYYMELVDEIIDRFGDMPEEVANLMDISYIKHVASLNEILAISENKDIIKLEFKRDSSFMLPENIQKMADEYGQKINFDLSMKPGIYFKKIYFEMTELKRLIDRIDSLNNS